MVEIAENQIHEVTLTCPVDLSGHQLEIAYVEMGAPGVTIGGSAGGAGKGSDVSLCTDLAATGVDPGHYELEVRYEDEGVVRALPLEGATIIEITDSQSV